MSIFVADKYYSLHEKTILSGAFRMFGTAYDGSEDH